jgi:hypothetical protein
MRRPIKDHILAEVRAATDRRKGVKQPTEPRNPELTRTRRRLEEIEDERRLREATEWL